jgi:hypothetical protein
VSVVFSVMIAVGTILVIGSLTGSTPPSMIIGIVLVSSALGTYMGGAR